MTSCILESITIFLTKCNIVPISALKNLKLAVLLFSITHYSVPMFLVTIALIFKKKILKAANSFFKIS